MYCNFDSFDLSLSDRNIKNKFMKNVHYIQLYSDNLLQRIVRDILPYYDLWSLRSFVNQQYEHISGNCNEIEKFAEFISEYSSMVNPLEVLLVTANKEKNYPTIMLNTSKQYMIIKFIDNSSHLGKPLILPNFLS